MLLVLPLKIVRAYEHLVWCLLFTVCSTTFQKQTVGQYLLAAVRAKGEVAVLYTVTNRQTIPLCSVCVTKKCHHVFFYNKEKENEDRQFSSRVRRTSDLYDEEDETDSHEAE